MFGIVATMRVSDHEETERSVVELDEIPMAAFVVPCVAPNRSPSMVTLEPTAPDDGVMDEMTGFVAGAVTVNPEAVCAVPKVVVTEMTYPALILAKSGTRILICVLPQEVTVGVRKAPNLTVDEPCVAPKFAPLIVISLPLIPLEGEKSKI